MPAPATVLIIDDEEGVREALYEFLQLYGYTVITAATMQEAEDVRQRVGLEAIDLVISDIHLTPNTDIQEGYVLYQRWTALHPTLSYLFISGDPSSCELPAIRIGAARFLAKPFELNELLHAVKATLGETNSNSKC